jgi:hypothetical protein
MNAEGMRRHISESFNGVRILDNLGDTFFLYDPAGDLPPERQQPFATIVTGNHYDSVSDLDRPGAYRLNIGLTKATYLERFGAPPTERDTNWVLDTGYDHTAEDSLTPHPMYASQYWVSVVNPGPATLDTVRSMLIEAHGLAARKYANHQARLRRSEQAG